MCRTSQSFTADFQHNALILDFRQNIYTKKRILINGKITNNIYTYYVDLIASEKIIDAYALYVDVTYINVEADNPYQEHTKRFTHYLSVGNTTIQIEQSIGGYPYEITELSFKFMYDERVDASERITHYDTQGVIII